MMSFPQAMAERKYLKITQMHCLLKSCAGIHKGCNISLRVIEALRAHGVRCSSDNYSNRNDFHTACQLHTLGHHL